MPAIGIRPRFLPLAPLVCLFALAASGCRPYVEARVSRPAMGTVVEIVARGPDRATLRAAIEAAFVEIERLEQLLSEWRETSEISRLNRAAGGWLILSPETRAVLALSREIAGASAGAFDPTVLPLVRAYGFLGGPERVPTRAEIVAARALMGVDRLEIAGNRARLSTPGTEIGLAGIAKGYIADRALAVLRARGARAGLVNAGGDLAIYGGSRPFHVQIEVPDRPGEAFAELTMSEGGVATSAATYRAYERDGLRVSHVLDPRTGAPVAAGGSATVVAPDAARADAWATAFLVLGRSARRMLEDRADLEGILVEPDGRVFVSPALRERVRWLVDGSEPRLPGRKQDQHEHAGVEPD